ncbi:hypothetical protein ACE1CI_19105 [Aerosakkonemataceae cyanobacterium BLCC-F50]|uniref:Uncharacterized protein n=1 Tax=Floridaenema flaviceps BLCC-F50 TaxID=3153642 RepID=A0ABV4XTM2_9CYAN
MFQWDGLNQLFSNAPVTDRNVVADIDSNRDRHFICGEDCYWENEA